LTLGGKAVAKRYCIPGLLGALLLCPLAGAQHEGESGRVAALVGQLDSKRFAEREQATRDLDALGPAALEALREAARKGPLEVRRRAEALIRKIERRVEAARFLAPTKLRLVYKDVPLYDALTDTMLKTGLTIRLSGDTANLARRRLTLDTGELPFWEALDLFARKAGLTEVDEPPAPPVVQGARGMSVTVAGVVAGGNAARAVDVLGKTRPREPVVLTFQEARMAPVPTHVAGPVRLRALPPSLAGPAAKVGEIPVRLDVTAAPPLSCREVIGVRLTRALDDQGQNLPGRFVPPPSDPVPAAGRGMIVINGRVITAPEDRPKGPSRLVPLVFEAGPKPAKSLKELSGTLIARMESGSEILVTVPKVADAAGKKFAGPQGTWVHVAEVRRDARDNVTMRVEVAAPPRDSDDGSRPVEQGLNIVINGRRLGDPLQLLSDRNFSLLDAAGRPLQVTRAVYTGKSTPTSQEYELTFRRATPNGMTGEGVRFLYRDCRSAILEIPFTLRDVSLP
jgi:hypothetical protein